jgi:hypothetical protein
MRYGIILLIFLLLPVNVLCEDKLDNGLLKEIEIHYPQARTIEKKDLSPHIIKHNKHIQVSIIGDFDCNNIKDNAIQIYHNGVIKLIAIHRFKDGKYKIIEVSKTGEWNIESIKGRYEMVLALKKKGQRIEFYCDCKSDDEADRRLCKKYSDKKSLRGCSLRLKCDAIEWVYIEKGAELFYFDKENDRYQSVITAD